MVALSSSISLLLLVLLSLVLGAPAQATVKASVINMATPQITATPVVGAQAAVPVPVPVVSTGAEAAVPVPVPVVSTGAEAAVPVVSTGATATANLSSIPGASSCPEMAAFGPGGAIIQRKDYSMAREMTIFDITGNTTLGSISSPIYSYASENELRTTTGSLVAKLVSPTVVWDTTADLYDCLDEQIAEIQWSTSNWWTTMFNPSMRVFDIFDASQTKVATMETIKTGGSVSGRVHIALKVGDTTVVQLDLTPYGFTKSVLGIFGHFEKATITFIASPPVVVPPLLKDPRFLSLIASEEFSPGNHGPFVTVVFMVLPFACFFCCCCLFRSGKKSKDGSTIKPSEVLANANNEERSRLMGPGEAGMREAQQNAAKYPPQQQGMVASVFGGCCRRASPPTGNGMAPV